MTVPEDGYAGHNVLELLAMNAANYNRFLLAEVLRAIDGSGTRVVDFGAGVGTFAAGLLPHGIRPVCVEADSRQRGILEQKGFVAVPRLEDVEGDVDVVFSLNVLEHIEDDAGTLAQIRSVLRPGGRLYLYVPAFQVLYSSFDRKVGHIRRYRMRGLVELTRAAGLEVRRARYVDSTGFLAALAFRVRDNPRRLLQPRHVALFDRYVFPVNRLTDPLAARLFGKNIALLAVKPGS
jgi:SAM-dependent methyltransferase